MLMTFPGTSYGEFEHAWVAGWSCFLPRRAPRDKLAFVDKAQLEERTIHQQVPPLSINTVAQTHCRSRTPDAVASAPQRDQGEGKGKMLYGKKL